MDAEGAVHCGDVGILGIKANVLGPDVPDIVVPVPEPGLDRGLAVRERMQVHAEIVLRPPTELLIQITLILRPEEILIPVNAETGDQLAEVGGPGQAGRSLEASREGPEALTGAEHKVGDLIQIAVATIQVEEDQKLVLRIEPGAGDHAGNDRIGAGRGGQADQCGKKQ